MYCVGPTANTTAPGAMCIFHSLSRLISCRVSFCSSLPASVSDSPVLNRLHERRKQPALRALFRLPQSLRVFDVVVVLGANYVIMFIGWEGVGLCSYLLIWYWFKNIEYSNAARRKPLS